MKRRTRSTYHEQPGPRHQRLEPGAAFVSGVLGLVIIIVIVTAAAIVLTELSPW